MPFPYDEIVLENGLVDKPVLLSERTQKMLLMGLSKLENRYSWDEMTDSQWDELSDYIAQAVTETIIEQDMNVASYHAAERGSTQAIAANTDTKIQYQFGATPPQDWNVPVPSAGICTVTARVYLLSAATGAKRARLLHNDVNIAELYYGSAANAQLFVLSHVLEVQAGDYFSLEVNCLTASTAQISPFTPKLSMVIT